MSDKATRIAVKVVDPTTDANEQAVDSNGNAAVSNRSTLVDDAAFTPGTDPVDMIGATFDDTAPDSVDEGDGGALRMTAERGLHTTLRDAAGNERGANVTVDNQLEVLPGTSADTIAEDTAFPAAAKVFPMGAQFDDAAPNTLDEGDIGAPRQSAERSLHNQIRDAGGNERGANVDASNRLETLPSGATDAAAHGGSQTGVRSMGSDGTNDVQVLTDAAGHLQVDVLTGGGSDVPTNPTIDVDSSTDTAALASADLDSAEITEAEKLWEVHVSASVAFKFQVKAVEDGTPRNVSNLLFGRAGETIIWKVPHKDFVEHAGAAGGLDVFRATVTNMDTSVPADLHAAFYYST